MDFIEFYLLKCLEVHFFYKKGCSKTIKTRIKVKICYNFVRIVFRVNGNVLYLQQRKIVL